MTSVYLLLDCQRYLDPEFLVLVAAVDDVHQSGESCAAVLKAALALVVTHEDAALGVADGVARMNLDEVEARDAEQQRQPAAELRTAIGNHLVAAFGDGSVAGNLAALALQVAPLRFECVTDAAAVQQQAADGVALLAGEALQYYFHRPSFTFVQSCD